jgi:hypothetical protein
LAQGHRGVPPATAEAKHELGSSPMSIAGVPQALDGASVLSVAPASAGQLGFDYETGDPVAVLYYAIAQYAGDEPRAYLFAVDAAHQVVGDSLWDSPAMAAEVALNSGNVSQRFEPLTA